jgi:hypothetical protein
MQCKLTVFRTTFTPLLQICLDNNCSPVGNHWLKPQQCQSLWVTLNWMSQVLSRKLLDQMILPLDENLAVCWFLSSWTNKTAYKLLPLMSPRRFLVWKRNVFSRKARDKHCSESARAQEDPCYIKTPRSLGVPGVLLCEKNLYTLAIQQMQNPCKCTWRTNSSSLESWLLSEDLCSNSTWLNMAFVLESASIM